MNIKKSIRKWVFNRFNFERDMPHQPVTLLVLAEHVHTWRIYCEVNGISPNAAIKQPDGIRHIRLSPSSRRERYAGLEGPERGGSTRLVVLDRTLTVYPLEMIQTLWAQGFNMKVFK